MEEISSSTSETGPEGQSDYTEEPLVPIEVVCKNNSCENFDIVIEVMSVAGASFICGPCAARPEVSIMEEEAENV